MNVYTLNNHFSRTTHPLDDITPPDIVNTVIEDRPILFRDQYGTLCTDPSRRGLFVKGEQSPPINIVKGSYSFKGAQYEDLYRSMVSILKASGVDCRGAKVSSDMTQGGERGFITMTLPEYTIETRSGDESQFQITGRTSFDGSWAVVLQIGAVRMICTNGQVFMDSFSMYKAKHTLRMNPEHAERKLVAALDSYKNEAARWKRWTENSITDREALNLFAMATKCKFVLARQEMTVRQLFEEPEVYRNQALKWIWTQYTTDEQKHLGSTHWAAYNALTHWSTHAPATKKTAQANILAIKVRREEAIRSAVKSCLAA